MIGVENSARPDNCQTKLWVNLRQLGLKGLGAWGQVSQILTAATTCPNAMAMSDDDLMEEIAGKLGISNFRDEGVSEVSTCEAKRRRMHN